MTDWLDTLLRGTLEMTAPTLAMAYGGETIACGSGRASWRSDAGVRVQAVTDETDALDNWLVFGTDPPKIDLAATWFTASGDVGGGWNLMTHTEPSRGAYYRTPSSQLLWDFSTHGLFLTRVRESVVPGPRIISVIMGPPPPIWVRETITEIHNEQFGKRLSRRDWLLSRAGSATIAARHRSEQWFEIRVVMEDTSAPTEATDIIGAIGRAFGFLTGRFMVSRGFEDLQPDREVRFLQDPQCQPTRESLLMPLGSHYPLCEHFEELLGKATGFFMTDRGKEAAQQLNLCWDTLDNALRTRFATACICLEGLLRIASQNSHGGDPGFTSEDLKATRAWLNDSSGGLSPRYVERVQGFLGTLRNRRPVDVLWDWHGRRLLSVTTDDIDAWTSLRHPATHGSLVFRAQDTEELRALFQRYYRVVNLINKIILQLMGHDGKYMDYSMTYATVPEFRAVPAEDL